MPEIEFVDPDPDPGDDEELVSGRPHREWSSRTKRIVRIGAAAVLAVVAGSILVGVLHDDGGKDAAGGTPTLSGAIALAPEAPSGAFRVDHLGDAPEGARPGTLAGRTPTPAPPAETSVTIDDSVCPNENACTTHIQVPKSVSAALAHAFPSVTDVRGSSVTVDGSHPTLRGRAVTATVGTLKLSVLVHLATRYDNTTSSVADNGSTRIVYARTLSKGLAVTVSVSGSPSQVPSLAKVKALAADRRLIAVD